MKEPTSKEIALFPLPRFLIFPFRQISLYIFEPRYKKLIEDCMNSGREMAVVYARKSPSPLLDFDPASPARSLLKQDPKTSLYQPHNIFAAGRPEVLQKTKDGCYYITLHPCKRYKIESEVQNTPYIIGNCSEIKDKNQINCLNLSLEVLELKKKLDKALDSLTSYDPDKRSLYLTKISPEENFNRYTFLVLSLVGADDGLLLKALESQDPMERFEFIQRILDPLL